MPSDVRPIRSQEEATELACSRYFQIGEWEKLWLPHCLGARPVETPEGYAQKYAFFFPAPIGRVVSQPYRKGDLGELAYVAMKALRFPEAPGGDEPGAVNENTQYVFDSSYLAPGDPIETLPNRAGEEVSAYGSIVEYSGRPALLLGSEESGATISGRAWRILPNDDNWAVSLDYLVGPSGHGHPEKPFGARNAGGGAQLGLNSEGELSARIGTLQPFAMPRQGIEAGALVSFFCAKVDERVFGGVRTVQGEDVEAADGQARGPGAYADDSWKISSRGGYGMPSRLYLTHFRADNGISALDARALRSYWLQRIGNRYGS